MPHEKREGRTEEKGPQVQAGRARATARVLAMTVKVSKPPHNVWNNVRRYLRTHTQGPFTLFQPPIYNLQIVFF
jgi:hypothetical protein